MNGRTPLRLAAVSIALPTFAMAVWALITFALHSLLTSAGITGFFLATGVTLMSTGVAAIAAVPTVIYLAAAYRRILTDGRRT